VIENVKNPEVLVLTVELIAAKALLLRSITLGVETCTANELSVFKNSFELLSKTIISNPVTASLPGGL
jgi:hypothetical protein